MTDWKTDNSLKFVVRQFTPKALFKYIILLNTPYIHLLNTNIFREKWTKQISLPKICSGKVSKSVNFTGSAKYVVWKGSWKRSLGKFKVGKIEMKSERVELELLEPKLESPTEIENCFSIELEKPLKLESFYWNFQFHWKLF